MALLGRVVEHDHEVVEVVDEFGEGGVADGGDRLRLHDLHGPRVDLAIVAQVAVGRKRDGNLFKDQNIKLIRFGIQN